ncbi:Cysteine/Histidine-rich C1 domain family protein [Rhynchospora pubera]|uniref:Cysteine/Histidine-rich C1 domain family protein n=2 Tax=Rhynchospora pubera TaxID=906938 RepID=A0AAV8D120_9POAL|nr:Cysteine/Histidine-rich C1 domain family protein [Rhynchospora pubera]
MASSLYHCSHPKHKLVMTQSPSGQYICDLCRFMGSGLHYRCHACDFDLHEQCAKLPEKISFFAHPWHDLHLQPGTSSRICDLCRDPVEGFYYRCITCNFDVHPHCTKTQQNVYTKMHPQHSLCLVPALNICSACQLFDGQIWLYRCGICNVNLHIRCLHGPVMPKNHHNHANSVSNNNNKNNHFWHRVGTEVAAETTASVLTNYLLQFLSN